MLRVLDGIGRDFGFAGRSREFAEEILGDDLNRNQALL
jgi:hypothetical protein